MSLTIIHLNTCRRDRLRAAFSYDIKILGPLRTATIVEALVHAYQHHNTTRTNYNFALHALLYVAGLEGLAAIALVKEAWNPECLSPLPHDTHQHEQEPVVNITHPSTNILQ